MGEIQKSPARSLVRDKNTLKSLLDSDATKQMIKNVASKYMTEDRISKAALLALSRQPKLAQCSSISFLTSMMKAAQLQLDFSGATGQAYLIPYKTECTLIVGYQGMIEVAYRSKNVEYIDAQLVYENDECIFNLGTDPKIEHTPNFDGDRGEVKFGYAVARLKDVSIPKIELMSKDEIMAIKKRSPSRNDGPWKTDEPEMMRKTIIRRIFKYLPKTQEILTAAEIDNMSYDYSNKVAEDVKSGVEGLRKRIKDSTPTKEQTRQVESTVTPTEPTDSEAEKLDAAAKNAKKRTEEHSKPKRGRPAGSKSKKKTKAPPEPEAKTAEEMANAPDLDLDLQTEKPKEQTEQEKAEETAADKLEDYLYSCKSCGFLFNVPSIGHENKTQCPHCFTYDIVANEDEK